MNRSQPILGISSCLLGMNVRFDGDNKHHSFISSVLDKHFDLFHDCPEVAIGMGVPRAPIQLRILDGDLHAVGVNDHRHDVTTTLQAYARQQAVHAHAFCGYIFKSSSPSCGVSDTMIFSDHAVSAGPGIYAREIIRALPYLPVIDEIQLDQEEVKDNFLERVFCLVRWHYLATDPVTVNHIMDFHMTYRLVLEAHCSKADKTLSGTISNLRDPLPCGAIDDYLEQFHDYLKTPLRDKDHAGMLAKLQWQLAPIISRTEKDNLNTVIRNYCGNREKLITVFRYIKRLADSYNLYDLARQAYINPTPAEIALRYNKQQDEYGQ